jgi:hypothetical protein
MAVALFLGLQLADIKSKLIAVNAKKSMLINDKTIVALYERLSNFLKEYNILVHHSIFENGNFSVCNTFTSHDRPVFIPTLFSGCYNFENWVVISNELLYNNEHIKLDKTYSGKTFLALVLDAQRGALLEKNVLFWNTTFNTDAFDFLVSSLLEQGRYRDLPETFWHYFGYVRPSASVSSEPFDGSDDYIPGCG